MQDGAIRINKMNREDFRNLSDYWRLPMHDNLNGYISKMCFSYDEKYLFSCGHDGNVFAYKWLPSEKEYRKDMANRMTTSAKYTRVVLDEMGYEMASLEEAMIQAEKERIDKLADDRKNVILSKISKLESRFQILLVRYILFELCAYIHDDYHFRNSNLLPSQVVPDHQLELDPRVTKDLIDKLETELKLVFRKLEFSVRKSELGMKKILSHFLDPLESFPIAVRGIRNKVTVRVLRALKLSQKFYPMQEQVEQRILDEERRNR